MIAEPSAHDDGEPLAEALLSTALTSTLRGDLNPAYRGPALIGDIQVPLFAGTVVAIEVLEQFTGHERSLVPNCFVMKDLRLPDLQSCEGIYTCVARASCVRRRFGRGVGAPVT
jgi:hypothetical protein